MRLSDATHSLSLTHSLTHSQHAKEITENHETNKFTTKKTLQKLYFILAKAYYRLSEYDQAETWACKSREICEGEGTSDGAATKDEQAILRLLNEIKTGRLSAKKHENNVWMGKLAPKFVPTAIETKGAEAAGTPSNGGERISNSSSRLYFLGSMCVVVISYYVYQLYK